ncbi:hypothetical protein [Reichenbachiella sp. MALMAid0571]|uniref:hypothetical protein n=1 Tax=Reichenbachiella sp. MALMAid0571 TaxID=3143939 RepID=UPI0032DFDEB7
MVLLSAFILFAGFYILYRTSKRVEFKPSKAQRWVYNNTKLTRSVGLVLLLVSFCLLSTHYGIGAGIFMAMIVLMTIASLVIIISPLRRGNQQ